jgi:DNA-directed RNA polymerase
MDTNVLLKDPKVLHVELELAADKQDKLYDRAMANVGYGSTTGGLAITNQYLPKVTQAVTEKLSGTREQSHSFAFQIEHLLKQIRPEVLALCVLQSGLHAVALESTQVTAAVSMGHAINDELWAAGLIKADKKLAEHIAKQVRGAYGDVKNRKQLAKKLAAKLGAFTLPDWTEEMLSHAGTWAMNILLETMPDVFQLTEPPHPKAEREWVITDAGLEMAEHAVSEAVVKSPVYQPRTERPKDWDRFTMNVAEDDRTMARAQLLRTSHKDIISAAAHSIRTGKAAPALKAINTLQGVPFKINTWIMDVIQQCYDKGIRVDGLPYRHQFTVPDRVTSAEFNALSVEARRLHAKTIKGLKRANRANVVDRVAFKQDMDVAARQSVVEQFYCPMNMDWRGRVYALTHFNFQREDRVRSMFLFANGEAIGEEGIYWLKVHVANCGAFDKIDKKPIEERVQWVDENLTAITAAVTDPLGSAMRQDAPSWNWKDADAPFLFLAGSRELVSALQQGPTYVSHMPVSFDGSCSGLQHLAAMTLAPEGSHVNLTNNATPSDVYQLVADLTKKRIEADLNSDEMLGKDEKARPVKALAALALAFGVDRKLVKRNVMTFAYSSKEFGMSEQHFEDTMEPLELKLLKKEIDAHPFGETEEEWRQCSRYLAKRVLASIKEVVRGPAQAMEFMQKLAKALAHEGKPLSWTSPAGLPCINRYHENTTEVIELWCYDKGVKLRTQVTVATGYETPIAKEKAAAGIAPNFVHSHDAAHLLLTVAASADEGIADIATVHDSFGCLPSRATRFNQIIREQFLKMYTDHDVLSELLESARTALTPANHWRLDEAIAAMPQKGTLDLTEILHARYAFA